MIFVNERYFIISNGSEASSDVTGHDWQEQHEEVE